MEILLNEATTTGARPAKSVTFLHDYPAPNICCCWGVFDGCTVGIEVSDDNVAWRTALDSEGNPLTFTQKGAKTVQGRNSYFRATAIVMTPNTNVSCGVM